MELFELGDTVRLVTRRDAFVGPILLIIGKKEDPNLANYSHWLCLWPETGNTQFISSDQIKKVGRE